MSSCFCMRLFWSPLNVLQGWCWEANCTWELGLDTSLHWWNYRWRVIILRLVLIFGYQLCFDIVLCAVSNMMLHYVRRSYDFAMAIMFALLFWRSVWPHWHGLNTACFMISVIMNYYYLTWRRNDLSYLNCLFQCMYLCSSATSAESLA